MTQTTQLKPVREYKSLIFIMIFRDKKELYIYGTKVIPLPTPQFIVFYNGEKTLPDHEVLKLSDAYMVKDRRISLELIVDVLNVNVEYNKELLKACRTLVDYAGYVSRIRKYAKTMAIEEVVEKAIDECIQEGILSEFLKQNREEEKSMSIYEYNEEEHLRMERESAYEDGREQERKNTERENAERKRLRADNAEQRAIIEKQRADNAQQKAESERLRAEAAEAELRELREKYKNLKI